MKVHFITSRPTLEKDMPIVRRLIDIIHGESHILALDWVEAAYARQLHQQPASDWIQIYKENLEAIAQSDAVIAEATYENLAVGYQIAVAIYQKKPVLILRQDSADINAFVNGVDDGWVRHAKYNGTTLTPLLKKFLEDNDIKVKDLRFNFFIDRKIHNYLRWASYKSGKTKAEVIRELLKHDIEKGDY